MRSIVRPVNADFGTWHHGLIARWWAEFNVATTEEQAYFKAAIREFGEPALDLACGTGRISLAQAEAVKRAFKPTLTVQAMHDLDLGRTYRTVYICGSFGLGGRRDCRWRRSVAASNDAGGP